MNSIAKSLRSQHSEDELYILSVKRNSGNYTYDGIELGGERVCAEIEEELRSIESRGGKITKLSVVGYSLGGLVSRYAVGLLYAKGILDTVECMVRTMVLFQTSIMSANLLSHRTLQHLHLPISVFDPH